jgi:1,4-dihydroxy-2-naphthoyl-CoA synthase
MIEKHVKDILYDKDDDTGVVVAIINRPEIKNSLTVVTRGTVMAGRLQ